MRDGTTLAVPLSPEDADRAFAGLEVYDRLVLAVSGGADSTCLMLLAAGWAQRRDLVERLLVVTIDHGLRPEAAGEVTAVARAAAKLGLAHVGVTNTEPPPHPAFTQAWARELRYRHLAEAALRDLPETARAAIVLAHHEADQAETVLMRLARGSGVDGLGAMRRVSLRDDGIALVRPLLAVPKARLVATLQAAGMEWAEDPSNRNPRFERVKLREADGARAALGLSDAHLALTAKRAARATAALDALTRRALSDPELVTFHPYGYVRVSWARLLAEPEDLRLRLLTRALNWLGPKPVSLGQLESLTDDWSFDYFSINNCSLSRSDGALIVGPEPGRRRPMAVRAGETHRFGAFTCVIGALAATEDNLLGHMLGSVDGVTQRYLAAKVATLEGAPPPQDVEALPPWICRLQPALYALRNIGGQAVHTVISCPTLRVGQTLMTATLPRHPGD